MVYKFRHISTLLCHVGILAYYSSRILVYLHISIVGSYINKINKVVYCHIGIWVYAYPKTLVHECMYIYICFSDSGMCSYVH